MTSRHHCAIIKILSAIKKKKIKKKEVLVIHLINPMPMLIKLKADKMGPHHNCIQLMPKFFPKNSSSGVTG